jgi:hypothetical protein
MADHSSVLLPSNDHSVKMVENDCNNDNIKDHHHVLGRKNGDSKHFLSMNWIHHLLRGRLRGGDASSTSHQPQVRLKPTLNVDQIWSARHILEEEDDQGIDAYIESLIASVDEEEKIRNNNNKQKDATTTTSTETTTPKDHTNNNNVNNDNNTDSVVDDQSILESSDDVTKKPIVDDHVAIEENLVDDDEEEEEEEGDDEEETDEEKDGDQALLTAQLAESGVKNAQVPSNDDNDEEVVTASVSSKVFSPRLDSSVASAPPKASTATLTATTIPEQRTTTTMVRPVRPNFLYRFLLGQGRIGHVLILLCVMVVEFLRTYLPPVERFLTWSDERYRRREQIRLVQELERRKRQQQQKLPSSKRRGKQKEPSRRAIQKQADQRALSQLRQLGNVAMAKYRWVSDDFMKRHGLGPFATHTPPSSLGDEQDKTYLQHQGGVVQNVKQRTKKQKKAEDDDEDNDVDWIVEALTTSTTTAEAQPRSNRRGSSSSGVSIEFHLGANADPPAVSPRRTKSPAWIKSVLSSSSSSSILTSTATASSLTAPRSNKGSRPSRENGVLDRLRAASGVDNMSRSLLGAYPGDAVPTSEAASADGLLALARKYGYGEWSDDEDEEVTNNDDKNDHLATSPRRTKRRKVVSPIRSTKKNEKPEPQISLGLEAEDMKDIVWGLDDGKRLKSPRRKSSQKDPTTKSRIRRISLNDDMTTTASTRRKENSSRRAAPPLASSAILNRSGRASHMSEESFPPSSKRTTLIRPAMQRLKEKRKELEQNQTEDS